jgi:exportin-2 (importin alpha re-exporter)
MRAFQLGSMIETTIVLTPRFFVALFTAENRLKQGTLTAGHPLQVLHLIASSNAADAAVRQAAAVHFKNIVKNGWDENREDGTNGIVVSPQDRNTIKSHLVELMCTVPHQIQAQISESIALIAAVDYPKNWDDLLPKLVQQFNSTDLNVLNGVLKTANSIFKSFRYVGRSDALYNVILYTLDKIQEPLLTLFVSMGQAVEAYPNDPAQLKPRFEALRTICRIYYSLMYQDLPEYFEDHMGQWMGEFAKYLQYKNPVLSDADEELEPSPIDTLQAAIVENLSHFAGNDEETFVEYLPNFTTLIWNNLMGLTTFSKHDTLVTKSIKFLSSLVAKQMHRDIFKDEATLRQIMTLIVIPNLMIREVDEERFEDDPQDFILTEVEGNDSESRRRNSQELLRAMCRQFEAETTAICSEHVNSMLSEFSADNSKWKAKDAAVSMHCAPIAVQFSPSRS